jgi:hypothetical protein
MSRLRELVQDVRAILERTRPSSKYIAYFQLLDAFKQPGCPVCTRLEQGAIRSLDALMYEQVNDPFTRDRLVASHGFCNWHAWMLPSVANSASGVALIYRHLLQETLDRLVVARQEARPRRRWRRLWERLTGSGRESLPMLAWRQRKTRCPLCGFARQAERDDLRTILEFIAEPEFGGAFARSSGLCLPHLYAAMAVGRDHPSLSLLLAMQEARWKDLVWELEEFARKFDYRYADEAKGRETSSWHRALEVFTGRASLFGPERGDWPSEPRPGAQGIGETSAAQAGVAGAEPLSELETLRFENEKLRRRIEELLSPREQDRQTRLTLEFQILKLTADLKSLAAGVAAHQSEPAPAVHPPLPEPPAPLQRPDCEVGHTAVSDPDHAA